VTSRRSLPRLLLVTGMSGAGKSTVLDALEDMGWDTVDNLPVDLLQEFVHGGGQCRTANAAIGMDVRSRGFDAETLGDIIHSMEGVEPELLYLDCSGTELTRRYDETRRLHPLAPDRPAEDGIARERQMTWPLRSAADSLIDTTDLSPAELRDELQRRFGGDADQPVLTVASFSFARGISRTADLVFDLRFLPNPHWVEELRPLTGLADVLDGHLVEVVLPACALGDVVARQKTRIGRPPWALPKFHKNLAGKPPGASPLADNVKADHTPGQRDGRRKPLPTPTLFAR